jgi:predicted nuclease of predicted toxin-antitoxin system
MRFKTDENVPLEAVDLLRAAGHDAFSVFDQSLAGQPDDRIASVCQQEDRVLITLDTDFADIRTYPPAHYPGIIVLRLASQSVPQWKSARKRDPRRGVEIGIENGPTAVISVG